MMPVIGPNETEATKRAEWEQLTPHYKGIAVTFHRMGEGKVPNSPVECGGVYVKMALAMQRSKMTLTQLRE